MRPVAVDEPSGTRRVLSLAGLGAAACLLLAFGLPNGDLLAGARARFDIYMPRLIQMISHPAPPAPPRAQAHARRGNVHAPDLRAEIAAAIAARR
jgi:hypothetical protein